MARRRGRAPRWVQWLIVWIVVSGLGSSGLMYLRARGVVDDRVFQPVLPLVCGQGARLDTAYGTRDERVDDRGRNDPASSRALSYAALDEATCVAPDGTRVDAKGRLTAVILGLGALGGGVLVGLLFVAQRR